jgi:hypothetical protein
MLAHLSLIIMYVIKKLDKSELIIINMKVSLEMTYLIQNSIKTSTNTIS